MSHSPSQKTRNAGANLIRAKADEFAARVGPTAQALRDQGLSLNKVAIALTEAGIRPARSSQWDTRSVRNVLTRYKG